ncbi:DUF3473 domain-containing protein [Desulfosarcina cetonica]|uniref:DUF3473 domain-containing protein n=1 Tax=Desulfosarcina cetonica TaxID=90730 RepID=UPI0006D2CB56|nr:DUF3473 domain-containing protein [Desulfosarcina cetonica]
MTFDLEDWFHILDIPDSTRIDRWKSFASRAEIGLRIFLELLDHRKVTCTFFILGWMAERHPGLVRLAAESGHEIACHGYAHQLIYNQRRDLFREDLRKSKQVLENISGMPIAGYRGPGFSITPDNLWAFDDIAESGFTYDATIFSGNHGHGGIPGIPSKPFKLKTLSGLELEEYPIASVYFGKAKTAFSGGGYFRLFPRRFIAMCIERQNRQDIPVVSYFHPRDFDPNVPRMKMSFKRLFKSYVNVGKTVGKLDFVLSRYRFMSISAWRREVFQQPQEVTIIDFASTGRGNATSP